MRSLLAFAASTGALAALLTPGWAWGQDHQHHHHTMTVPVSEPINHSIHSHEVGPAGATYDLRWIDAMVQHHIGALRMSEVVFNVGSPGVGALANTIWADQASEIKAMGQWRKAWYPQAPVFPVVLPPGGNPDALAALAPMSATQIDAMRMLRTPPSPSTRITWFLEGMLAHHGGALQMAHDALNQSTNPTIRRLARQIIVAQRREIVELRRMLLHDGLNKPEYTQFDGLFAL